jgi:DNA-binding transcriptional MerR regulator/methylmalonyl-CoA mutase cobalamin-binding subunit
VAPSSHTKEKRHPIQVVARRTGLSADVLRAWEKRYGILRPARSSGGRRLYSDDDIDFLRLLRRATGAGRNVGQLVDLSREALQAVVREDEAAATIPSRAPSPAAADAVVDAALGAVAALEGPRLEIVLRRAMIENDATRFLDAVIVPLLMRVGTEWRHDRVTPAHEHLASRVIRRVLEEYTATFVPRSDAPRFLSATPQGQRHEFGAMLAAAAAAAAGWGVTYLGADLPAAAIADAARQAGASVVGLSIVHPGDDPQIPVELRALRVALPADVVLIVGGAGAVGHAKVLRETRAVLVPDLASLRPALESVARAPQDAG